MVLPPPSGVVSLLTDFGLSDPYVGIMHGMVKREHRRAEIVDLCHAVPPQAIRVGAMFLAAAKGRFPPGTVHVAVVDPGVGTDRRLLGVVAHQCYWLAPDNGLLSEVLAAGVDEVRELAPLAMDVAATSATFHGRDIFAPVAGRLSSGRYGFRSIGRRIDDPVLDSAGAGHRVIHVDHFGNLITDIPAAALHQAGADAVQVGAAEFPIRTTYGATGPGQALALINSYDLVEIAISGGDAHRELGIAVDTPVALVGSSPSPSET